MIKLYSYGKINLFLDVKGKLENSYHSIRTVMQSIDLYDEIQLISTEDNKILIECNSPSIPLNEENTCYKAASHIKEKYHINSGVIIKINKVIPSEAGLAGGSSNSAAVIKGLNKLWKLNLSVEELLSIGVNIGADVPFCINGGTYLAEGIGEKLTKLNDFKWDYILLIKPEFSMSTAFVYNNLTTDNYNLHTNNKIINYIKHDDYLSTAKSTANTLERVVEKFHPEINDIKNIMLQEGAISSLMTGSGSAMYGLFPDIKSLNSAYDAFKGIYHQVYMTRTNTFGVKIFD
ncbi:4-(cytidine 5'-diphospho)-2-C-methyl-D-erythritol kinase [Sedimentibacter hydroxybenzoicus DSM 7310]|uniref:4-diphosphocytidyl-2-C-methyl-D-erythritol kinase n=1 Tax=Sedimentibacter hydroxybenzoicus DSM 7310 TaxID=1123245 RepID=A0A974BK08_SEDHY|nr:4-(cytidine 5'-diphospho)-2-C-methyl-D-erythritol kinase [Sedimentibacter hydroxybenzoicus]NYB74699.1 4-(cytidine 5'-diphospho)-2-C-methyl-D-erythritol kinase [Sedimentibacter hydroxybenzoicus DSM 7310]